MSIATWLAIGAVAVLWFGCCGVLIWALCSVSKREDSFARRTEKAMLPDSDVTLTGFGPELGAASGISLGGK